MVYSIDFGLLFHVGLSSREADSSYENFPWPQQNGLISSSASSKSNKTNFSWTLFYVTLKAITACRQQKNLVIRLPALWSPRCYSSAGKLSYRKARKSIIQINIFYQYLVNSLAFFPSPCTQFSQSGATIIIHNFGKMFFCEALLLSQSFLHFIRKV